MTITNKKESKGFCLSVDFFKKPEICAVTVEHGVKGQAATIMLLCAIYRNGYFIEWTPENYISILKELPGINICKMQKIVKTLVEWGFFDKSTFDEHQVLTSREIQQQYMMAQGCNLNNVDTLPYWMKDGNEVNINEEIEKENGQNPTAPIGTDAISFPACPSECIDYILQEQPMADNLCAMLNIKSEELREWLEMVTSECVKKGKNTFVNLGDLINYLSNRVSEWRKTKLDPEISCQCKNKNLPFSREITFSQGFAQ